MRRMWIAVLIVVVLLAVTQLAGLARDVTVARAGKLLRSGLVLRDKAGDLPFGPDTPGIYALARASGQEGVAPKGAAGALVSRASDQLNALPGACLLYTSRCV